MLRPKTPGPLRASALVLLAAALATPAPAQAAAGDDGGGPTAPETLALELLNRFRANPALEAQRLHAPTLVRSVAPDFDWQMFKHELKEIAPAPPLVFDARLVAAARAHSRHVARQLGAGQAAAPGHPGFSGESADAQVRAAGFEGPVQELVLGNALSVEAAHFAFVLDDLPGGAGGMRDGRPHRTAAVAPAAITVGIGIVPNGVAGPTGEALALTILLGGRDARRQVGGVVICDLDGDGLYDVGEGIGGALFSAGASATTSWASGAFALALDSDKAGTLKVNVRGVLRDHALPKGDANPGFLVDVWPPIEKRMSTLLALLEKATNPTSGTRKAAADLFALTEAIPLPAPLRARADALTADAARLVLADREAIAVALDREQDRPLSELLTKTRVLYRGTAADAFFAQAERFVRLRKAVQDLEGHAAKGLVPKKPLEKARDESAIILAATADPALRRIAKDLDTRLATLARGSGQDGR